MANEIRLQKFLADSGVASRRTAEEMIAQGRVLLNGKKVTLAGTKVVPGRDEVKVDGHLIRMKREKIYILLNKPKGYVTTTSDPQGRKTVMELVKEIDERLYPVGRLDYQTEGLLILTNDGELTHGLTHPSREIRKTYQARIRGRLTLEEALKLTNGIQLDDGVVTAPAELMVLEENPEDSLVEIIIHEGRYRQVRRMFEAVNHEVIRLVRTRIGPLTRQGLARGKWRYLKKTEVRQLQQMAGIGAKGKGGKKRG